MGVVLILTFAFVAISLLAKKLLESLMFWWRGGWKYQLLDTLADYIYYGPDIGVEATLSLDGPSEDVMGRRRRGQTYLYSKLGRGVDSVVVSASRGNCLSQQLVDCRFALSKVLVPLLRELEFSPKRAFVLSMRNGSDLVNEEGSAGMLRAVVSSSSQNIGSHLDQLLYVGNDAVHTLGVHSFHRPLQEEINRRMEIESTPTGGTISSMLRFAPISLNPELEKNANMILEMTGLDQVRYSLSGSEAMDAAFKDVRSTCRGKKWIVRFKSAYHGHVSGVDYLNARNIIYLKECDQASIQFIRDHHYRIAAVVVNPMQHFTGINKVSPPGEKLTIGSRVRSVIPKDEYAKWLHDLADACQYCTQYLTRVAFIVDDIYFAFRTPELFSYRYFTHPATGRRLSPDVIVLGKGIAAGYPLSMVLAKRGYLNTYDKKFLLQVNKTVGTLAAWYGGLVASNCFLEALQGRLPLQISVQDQLKSMVERFDTFTTNVNQRFEGARLPLRMRNFANTFSVDYLSSSLYNSRYPQYLMAEGIYLGNYSTGKFNLTADATEKDLEELTIKFVAAGQRMMDDGYFEPNRHRLRLMLRLAGRFTWNFVRLYYNQMMEDKRVDIEVSHNHPVNKWAHFWSSVFMLLFAYPWCLTGKPVEGCLAFLFTHVVRQSGHFFYERQDRDIEKLKFGHKDGSKKGAAFFLALALFGYAYFRSEIEAALGLELGTGEYFSLMALFTIVPHYVEITHQYGWLRGLEWMIKILTDPITDLIDFYPFWVIHPKWFVNFKEHRATYKLDLETKKITKVA